MKKLTLIALVLIVALSSVFAAETTSFPTDASLQYTIEKTAYRPTFTTRLNKLAYRIWDNPAELAGGKFIVDFPEVAVSFNNIGQILTEPTILNLFKKGAFDMSNITSLIAPVEKLFTFFGTGSNTTNDLFKMDIGFGAEIGGFGVRADVDVDLNTYNPSGRSSLTSIYLVPEVNAAVSVGLGLKIIDTDALTVKAGASAHPSIKAFTQGISVMSLLKDENGTLNFSAIMSDPTSIVTKALSTNCYLGWAVPFDVSASVGFLKDSIKVYAKANNIMGTYHYISGDYKKLMGVTSDIDSFLKTEKTFDTAPFELDFGACGEFNFIGIHPTAYVEFDDMYAYCQNVVETETFTWTELYSHMNWGAELTLFKIVQLGFGYSDGYKQIAAGVGLNDIRVQAMYGSHKYNNNAADTLTVVIKLGWDANK